MRLSVPELGTEEHKSPKSLWIVARDALGLVTGFSGNCDGDAGALLCSRQAL
jgi:hypothetical protein